MFCCRCLGTGWVPDTESPIEDFFIMVMTLGVGYLMTEKKPCPVCHDNRQAGGKA